MTLIIATWINHWVLLIFLQCVISSADIPRIPMRCIYKYSTSYHRHQEKNICLRVQRSFIQMYNWSIQNGSQSDHQFSLMLSFNQNVLVFLNPSLNQNIACKNISILNQINIKYSLIHKSFLGWGQMQNTVIEKMVPSFRRLVI